MPPKPRPHAAAFLSLALCGLWAAGGAGAQGSAEGGGSRHVSLSGSMGSKALVMIDGKPRTLAVGAQHDGVRLVSIETGGDAMVEVDGRRIRLPLGGAPASFGDHPRASAGTQLKLTAGPGGHFISSGQINGRSVQFLVDTGATNVSIGQADAQRLGLDLKRARTGFTQTANGIVQVHQLKLTSVRIGDVEVYNVDATVMPSPMSHVLLGNSFLTRFQMKRENDVMTLDKRP